jgi:carbamoyltransferase
MAGGVALNSVFNGKILKNTKFKKVWIQPDAGDGGSSLGAALYAQNVIFNKPRKYVFKDAYLGPSYSDKEIKKYLDSKKVNYTKFKTRDDMLKTVSKLLYEKSVVGWFQKGMEWGPRALGARSILADPTNPQAKELLNTKVKHREKFRPFAPVVTAEDANTYFECDEPVPEPTDYMLMVYPVRKEYQKRLPSITHVDGSGRLQTIRKNQNAEYYDLLKEFGKLSGIPILINTSFNIRGEPIVCTPHDAYRCMMGTGIDYLVMGNYLIKRDDNPNHMWDSEKLAKD